MSRLGRGGFEIAVSVSLVLEYESALLRHIGDSLLDEDDVRNFIDYVCQVAIRHDIFYLWRPFLRDPGDDLLLELAVAAECEAIVTHNVRDFAGAERFGLRVITPAVFLQKLRGQSWVR